MHECDADVGFCGLVVGVFCGEALPEWLETSHLRLHAALGVVSGLVLPEPATVVVFGAQRVVSGLRREKRSLIRSRFVQQGQIELFSLPSASFFIALAALFGGMSCSACRRARLASTQLSSTSSRRSMIGDPPIGQEGVLRRLSAAQVLMGQLPTVA